MDLEFEIPKEVPVMTLSEVVLFPQAVLPLHIFEPRYRQMLKDVIDTHRMFILASEDPKLAEQDDQFEPPCNIASVGVIRASHQSDDGTSNLILQGITRVKFVKIIAEVPYRLAEVKPLQNKPGTNKEELAKQQAALMRLFKMNRRLGGKIPDEFIGFLKSLDNTDIFVDLAAATLCEDSLKKQNLLETLVTTERCKTLIDYFKEQNSKLALERKLSRGLNDDQIEMN